MFTITPVTLAEFGTSPFAPRIGNVSCSMVPIGRPLGHPAGTGADRVSSTRDGPTGTNRAPVSAVSGKSVFEIQPNTSIKTWAVALVFGVTMVIVERPPVPTPMTARLGTASTAPKLTSDDVPRWTRSARSRDTPPQSSRPRSRWPPRRARRDRPRPPRRAHRPDRGCPR